MSVHECGMGLFTQGKGIMVIGHILVPLDGSRLAAAAVPFAATLAHARDARISLLAVVEPLAGQGPVTLVYASHAGEISNSAVLPRLIQERIASAQDR